MILTVTTQMEMTSFNLVVQKDYQKTFCVVNRRVTLVPNNEVQCHSVTFHFGCHTPTNPQHLSYFGITLPLYSPPRLFQDSS